MRLRASMSPCIRASVRLCIRAPVRPPLQAAGQFGGTAAAVRLVDIALVQHSGYEHLARHLPARLWGNRNSDLFVRKYGRTQP